MQATQYVQAPVYGQPLRPQQLQVQPVQPAQLDLSSLINQIVPIITLAMMFSILVPMMKQLGQAFQTV